MTKRTRTTATEVVARANEAYQLGYANGVEKGKRIMEDDLQALRTEERGRERQAVVNVLNSLATIADTASHLAGLVIKERS